MTSDSDRSDCEHDLDSEAEDSMSSIASFYPVTEGALSPRRQTFVLQFGDANLGKVSLEADPPPSQASLIHSFPYTSLFDLNSDADLSDMMDPILECVNLDGYGGASPAVIANILMARDLAILQSEFVKPHIPHQRLRLVALVLTAITSNLSSVLLSLDTGAVAHAPLLDKRSFESVLSWQLISLVSLVNAKFCPADLKPIDILKDSIAADSTCVFFRLKAVRLANFLLDMHKEKRELHMLILPPENFK